VAGGVIIGAITLLAIAAPLVAPFDPVKTNLGAVLAGPSWPNLFGTDELGRDLLSRTLYGGRVSLVVGVLAVALAMVLGTVSGLCSGFWSGKVDALIMLVMDGLLAIPALLLAAAVAAALGPGLANIVIAVGLVTIPSFARLARAQSLSIREEEYVQAARVAGSSNARILGRHLLPNIATPIIVLTTLRISTAILAEASLSFIGLGVQPPTPTWGLMVNSGQRYLQNAPWVALAPGAAIFVCILGFSLLGDGLRDALDPQSRSGQST
jgi:peptide/nickel transport system permease protein